MKTFLFFILTTCSMYSLAAPIKVAILDTGLGYGDSLEKNNVCSTGSFDFVNNKSGVGLDGDGHGTIVADLIKTQAGDKKYCLLIYKVLSDNGVGKLEYMPKALMAAFKAGATVINMSLSGPGYSEKTRQVIDYITRRGVKIYAAAGNNNQNLNEVCNVYPACFKGLNNNFVVVGSLDREGDKAKYSNYGAFIGIFNHPPVRGTSFSSALATGEYITTR